MKPAALLLAFLAAAALLAACGAARPVLTNTGTASDSIPDTGYTGPTYFAKNVQASNAGAISDPECINCVSEAFIASGPITCGSMHQNPCPTAAKAAQTFTPGAWNGR